MARTVTPGYTQLSGGIVTPTRLNTAISGASIVDDWTSNASSFTAASNNGYLITGDSVVVTLPASPADNDYVDIASGDYVTGCSVARNGKTIMGLSENMTVDASNFSFRLVYQSSTGDWRLV